MLRRILLLAVALATVGSVAHADAPCSGPEYRQFDFWVGEWQVQGKAGKLAGINRITQEYGGCVIHEHYATGRGYSGESLNTYDAARKVWHQTWVDDSGLLLTLEGGLVGKDMVLEGVAPTPAGVMAKQRITWTPNPDGSVRQLWEVSTEPGKWKAVFEGLYTKK